MKRDFKNLAEEFLDAASEDLAMAEISYKCGFYASACANSARYAEKVIKAKLAMEDKLTTADHDMQSHVQQLNRFPGKTRALDIAKILSQYATQATYPTRLRRVITQETADLIMGYAIEMADVLNVYAPAKTYQTKFFNENRKGRRRGLFHRRR